MQALLGQIQSLQWQIMTLIRHMYRQSFSKCAEAPITDKHMSIEQMPRCSYGKRPYGKCADIPTGNLQTLIRQIYRHTFYKMYRLSYTKCTDAHKEIVLTHLREMCRRPKANVPTPTSLNVHTYAKSADTTH